MAAVIQMTSVNPQKSYLRRSLILTMKLLIAVVGLWYVISQISWHDRVFIDAGAKIRNVTVLERTSVRLLAWRHGRPQVKLAGQEIRARLASGQVITGMANQPPISLPITMTLPVDDLVQTRGRLEISRGLIDLIKSARPWPMLAALLLIGLPTFITTWRWQKLLAVQDLHLSYGKCLTLTFVSHFYSTFLPGHSGGDVVKVAYAGRMTAQPTKTAVKVLVDRAIGLVTLLMLAVLATTLLLLFQAPGGGAGPNSTDPLLVHILWVVGAALIAVCAGMGIYFCKPLRRRLGIDALVARLPVPGFIKHADQSLQIYRGEVSLLGLLVLVTMGSQLAALVAGWLISQAFGMHASLGCYIVYMSVISLALILPIVPPAGLGVLDSLLVYFFVTRGVDSANQAFALAQGLRLLSLFWTMLGVYWVVRGEFPRPVPLGPAGAG